MAFEKRAPGTRFSKVPRTFRARKAIRELRPAYSVKLVFSYVLKGIKMPRDAFVLKITSPEIRPKSFGTFKKQAPVFLLFVENVMVAPT